VIYRPSPWPAVTPVTRPAVPSAFVPVPASSSLTVVV
jgi:hypothetical protein